jgi:hypothetical protein
MAGVRRGRAYALKLEANRRRGDWSRAISSISVGKSYMPLKRRLVLAPHTLFTRGCRVGQAH